VPHNTVSRVYLSLLPCPSCSHSCCPAANPAASWITQLSVAAIHHMCLIMPWIEECTCLHKLVLATDVLIERGASYSGYPIQSVSCIASKPADHWVVCWPLAQDLSYCLTTMRAAHNYMLMLCACWGWRDHPFDAPARAERLSCIMLIINLYVCITGVLYTVYVWCLASGVLFTRDCRAMESVSTMPATAESCKQPQSFVQCARLWHTWQLSILCSVVADLDMLCTPVVLGGHLLYTVIIIGFLISSVCWSSSCCLEAHFKRQQVALRVFLTIYMPHGHVHA
jgi:hypothetical protein